MSDLPLKSILGRVSRSFYLSLWLLPRETRDTTALAYLLARGADTVADTRVVAPDKRVRLLEHMDGMFQGTATGQERAATLTTLASLPRSSDMIPEEQALLVEMSTCLAGLDMLHDPEQTLVRRVLQVIISGMRDDLMRFPGQKASDLAALDTRDELLHYCWQVAGCVGEFWSDLHAERLPSLRNVDRVAWRGYGLQLGRTLQLTNVLRDVHRDLTHGRCYLPAGELKAMGLAPGELLHPGAWTRLRPLYDDLVGQAVRDGMAGLRHTLWVPSREVWLRLAGFLPLLLALLTLGVVVQHNPLDPTLRRKITRRQVYTTLWRSFIAVRQDRELVSLFKATVREAGLERYLEARS